MSRSLHQFQAALNGLINNPRGRFAAYLQDNDYVEEEVAPARAPIQLPRGGQKKKVAPVVRAPRGTVQAPVQQGNKPLTFAQARVIGNSVGGMRVVCPSHFQEATSFHKVLLGHVTHSQASEIIEAMVSAGVAVMHPGMKTTAAQKRKAAQILMSMSSFVCPVDNDDVALDNPRKKARKKKTIG